MAKKSTTEATGSVTNVSQNPVELPDGSTLGAGETRDKFDESSLTDNLFLDSGWLVVGKSSKQLQEQLNTSAADVEALNAQIVTLQDALQAATLRAETAEASLAAAQNPAPAA